MYMLPSATWERIKEAGLISAYVSEIMHACNCCCRPASVVSAASFPLDDSLWR